MGGLPLRRNNPHAAAIGLIVALIVLGTLMRIWFVVRFAEDPLSASEIAQGIVAHQLLAGKGLSHDEALQVAAEKQQEDLGHRVELEDVVVSGPEQNTTMFSDDPGYAMVQAAVWRVAGSERWSHMVLLQLLLEVLTAVVIAKVAWSVSDPHSAVLSVAALQFVGVSQLYWMARPYHYAWPLYVVSAVILGALMVTRAQTPLARTLWCVGTLVLLAGAPFLRSTLIPMAVVVSVYWGLKLPRRRDGLILATLALVALAIGMGARTTMNSRLLELDRAARGSMWHSVVTGYGNFQPNPFGVPAADLDVAAHVAEETGAVFTYATPEYEAAAREYALEIISSNPAYYGWSAVKRLWMSMLDDGAMRWTVKQLGATGFTVAVSGRLHNLLSLALSILAIAGAIVLSRSGTRPEAVLLGGMWLFLPVVTSLIHYGARYYDGGLGAKYVLAAIGITAAWDAFGRRRQSTLTHRRENPDLVG